MANLLVDSALQRNSTRIEEPLDDKKVLIKLKDRSIVNEITSSLTEVKSIIKKNDRKLTESQQMKEDY